jgi:phosphatidate cytidylyltransferase
MRSLSLSFFFVICFAVPWMADAGAFFAGSLFGKHKLCPNISPKKTVEGAIGGVFTCVLAAVAIGFLFGNLITPQLTVNFIPLIIIGVCDAVLSIVGDLSFSLIKRTIGIKDYSNLFPGHGGMLDRFDSIIFTVPMVLIVNSFLPILSAG